MSQHPKIIFLLITFLATSSTIASASLGKNIYQKSINSLVYIEAYDNGDRLISQGSGFFIEKNKVVTNFHVIKNSTYLLMYNIDGKFTICDKVYTYDIEKDIAILQSNAQSIPLKIKYKDNPSIGDNIFVISSPRGFKFTISDGILSGNRKINNVNLYQMTAPISPGSSGGAVFDDNGNVIGIASSYFKDGQNINFSIPIIYTKDLIKHNGLKILSEIEDPELALENIFLTIFERISPGMSEVEFLESIHGCKYITNDRKRSNVARGEGLFATIDKITNNYNKYYISNARFANTYFKFTFSFSDSNALSLILIESDKGIPNSKYCYDAIVKFFDTKFKEYKKISELENEIKQQEFLKESEHFIKPGSKSVTSSWITVNNELFVTHTEIQKRGRIMIFWSDML